MFNPSPALDPRTTLARPDLAVQALEGLVRARAFRAAEPLRGRAPVADIHAEASQSSERIDQLLFGEVFDGLERRGDRVWGQARRDGTVGWVDAEALAPAVALPTHRVAAVDADLPLNALVRAGDDVGPDLVEIGLFGDDPVTVAERLLGVPHALGARSSRATDCSGLVQQALLACGLPGPRRAHEQAALGTDVARAQARRGDLAIWLDVRPGQSWTGHSAFVLDADRVLHATGHHGAVVIEAFAEADARCRADGFQPVIFRRIRP
ncbi:NlpC/P60 family protein [Brevundimonas sp. LM2]|uniref:C40 family peptidase n=1 Tax=Brevundimonas sp. LM2 TaxID=1938605 RepID=UPI0009853BB1|nr:NlpC/P60 family protein [Brevundimonas sp. LM2]